MKKWVGWTVAVALVLLALFAVTYPLMIGALDKDIAAREQARSDFPIKLGIGGAGCSVARDATQFTIADPIRLIGDQAPGAANVVIYLFPIPHHSSVYGYPVTRQFESTAKCVSHDLGRLPAGDYEAWIEFGGLRSHVDFHVDTA